MPRYLPPSPVTPNIADHQTSRSRSSPSPTTSDTASSPTDGRRVLRPRCGCKKVHGPDQCPLRREGVHAHAPTTGLNSPPESPPTTSSGSLPYLLQGQSERITSPKRSQNQEQVNDLASLPASPLRRQDAVEIHYNHAEDTVQDLNGTTTPPRAPAQALAPAQGSPPPSNWELPFTIPADRAFWRRNPNWKDPSPEPSPSQPIARSPSQDTELIDGSMAFLEGGRGLFGGMHVQHTAQGDVVPPPNFRLVMPGVESVARARRGTDTMPNSLIVHKRSKSRSKFSSSLGSDPDVDPMDAVREVMDSGYLGQLHKFGASRQQVEWIRGVLESRFFLGVINHRTVEELRPLGGSGERGSDGDSAQVLAQAEHAPDATSSSSSLERKPSCTVFISDDKDLFDQTFGYEERERLLEEERKRVRDEHVDTLLGLSRQMRGVYEQDLAWMRPKIGLMFVGAMGLGALLMLLWLTSWVDFPVFRL